MTRFDRAGWLSVISASVIAALLPVEARGGSPATWSFDITTNGENVAWTSPTAVNPSRPQYDSSYTITGLFVNARLGILNLGPIDVINEIPPEDRSGAASGPGPAPATFFSEQIVYPDPPAATGFAGLLTVSLDAAGFGHLSLTNVVLGPVTVDLGPPFGVQTVTLTRVRTVGSVTVDPIPCPADLTADGVVNASDLALMLGAWNTAGPGGDLNLDGIVNASDLAQLLGAWGPCPV